MENTLSTEGAEIVKEKERESEELKIFIENINRKEESKDNVSIKKKEEEPKQYKRTDSKKYLEIHKHSIRNYVEIQALRERNKGEIPYTNEELQKLVAIYMDLCALLNYPITQSGLALYIGIDDESKQAKELGQILKPLLEWKLNSQANNGNVQFLMKHRYKRNDKLEITATTNQQTAQGVVDRIIQENEQNKGGKALEILQ